MMIKLIQMINNISDDNRTNSIHNTINNTNHIHHHTNNHTNISNSNSNDTNNSDDTEQVTMIIRTTWRRRPTPPPRGSRPPERTKGLPKNGGHEQQLIRS